MDNDLISKKELLEETGISYGQLYRWKRKNLIPEEWFIRKSTYTGQETFFPREKILTRVNKIKDLKDELSLDEIALMFSPQLTEVVLTKAEIQEHQIVSDMSLDLHQSVNGKTDVFSLESLFYLFILDKFLQSGEMSLDEGKHLFHFLKSNYSRFQDKNAELFFIRSMGAAAFFLASETRDICFEEHVKVVSRILLVDELEKLKSKIQKTRKEDQYD
ncbi:YhbD family protein [Thermoactinomyces sp. AMNI-1]|uniref:YhbD family protein n=1 Tax=Thermoactinomyces mirandus TaxID=2756294 RepID=A0A7W2ATC4_9BACL|nr:YhbD family protein [Thermoactinomyces mirandus]MBA4603605.1 YhbD family protein [Thermoactinomyces mirandus]